MYNFKLLTIILAVLNLSEAQFSCEFNITDIPPNEPVYLEKNLNGTFKFLQPTNQMTILPYNKEITLLCPVAGNFFVDGETANSKSFK